MITWCWWCYESTIRWTLDREVVQSAQRVARTNSVCRSAWQNFVLGKQWFVGQTVSWGLVAAILSPPDSNTTNGIWELVGTHLNFSVHQASRLLCCIDGVITDLYFMGKDICVNIHFISLPRLFSYTFFSSASSVIQSLFYTCCSSACSVNHSPRISKIQTL